MKRRNNIKLALHRGVARAVVLGPLTFLLVAGAGCPTLFESPSHRAVKIKQAAPGNDGPKTISTPDALPVNAYVALSQNAAAGAETITVKNLGDLATNFSRALAQGDLLLIIQMQGATINTTNTQDFGSIASEAALGSAGRYEFVGVEGVTTATNQIALACPLRHAYSATGKTQVIRVPQYTTLTITGAGVLPAATWNGETGGIVAVHAQSTVDLSGTINVNAKGFRGGPTHNSTDSTAIASAYAAASAASGADKGESIAGYMDTYRDGSNNIVRYGRGAPANGGGGGTPHNGGGGGGANAGVVADWTGKGVMELCAAGQDYRDAWLLESACSNSEGGGRGGYSWSANVGDANTLGPNESGWGGDNRRNTGGLGGRPLASSTTSRLFMGGGGGAGDGNDGVAGRGGIGGGMVFLIAGSVEGSGTILANGDAGANDGNVAGGGDAGGGGGGGGTVVVQAGTIAGTLKIRANGGAGGRHIYSVNNSEVEGPGGGGGGGYIAVSGGTPDRQANGGIAGDTTRTAMSEFPVNGATAGHAGIINGDAASFFYCGATLATTIETKPANATSDTTGDFTFTNTSSPVTYQCNLDNGGWGGCSGGSSHTTAPLLEGSHTLSVRATDAYGNVEVAPPSHTWVVDTTPPDTSIATKPDVSTTDPTGEFTFGSNEPNVTYQYKLDPTDPDDPNGWTDCEASYTTPTLGNGAHTLYVRAVDAARNVDPSAASWPWSIALDGPITTIAGPKPFSNDSTPEFTFTNTKSPVTYQCMIDNGGVWFLCAPSGSYTTELGDGPHTLSVQSTETNTGTVESPAVTFDWVIDTAAPNTIINDKPAKTSANPIGAFTFEATDVGPDMPVKFECSLDGGSTWVACGATYTTPYLPNGPYTLLVHAIDAAGNVDGTPDTYAWDIQAVNLDGGTLDAGETEAGGIDGSPMVIDAPATDVEARDVQVDVPQQRDVGTDSPFVVVDVGAEARPEAPAVLAEAAGEANPQDVGRDTQPTGPETSPDSAVVGPETAPPVVKEDAAVVVNEDAAVTEVKVLGGGFCAISSSRAVSPAGFALLALAGLALLRRRRRQ